MDKMVELEPFPPIATPDRFKNLDIEPKGALNHSGIDLPILVMSMDDFNDTLRRWTLMVEHQVKELTSNFAAMHQLNLKVETSPPSADRSERSRWRTKSLSPSSRSV